MRSPHGSLPLELHHIINSPRSKHGKVLFNKTHHESTPNGSQNRSNSPTNQNPSRNPPRKHQKFGLKPVETTIARSSRDGSPPHVLLMWASAQMGKKSAWGFGFRCRNRRRARGWTRVSIVSAQIGIWRGKENWVVAVVLRRPLFFFFASLFFSF